MAYASESMKTNRSLFLSKFGKTADKMTFHNIQGTLSVMATIYVSNVNLMQVVNEVSLVDEIEIEYSIKKNARKNLMLQISQEERCLADLQATLTSGRSEYVKTSDVPPQQSDKPLFTAEQFYNFSTHQRAALQTEIEDLEMKKKLKD